MNRAVVLGSFLVLVGLFSASPALAASSQYTTVSQISATQETEQERLYYEEAEQGESEATGENTIDGEGTAQVERY